MRNLVLIIFLTASLLLGFKSAFAQSSWLTRILSQLEFSIEERLQVSLKDFRLVKRVENFEERFNATNKIQLESNPVGAIATLHNIHTGEPLESCMTPCNLHVDYVSEYVVMLYKYGHLPYNFSIKYDDELFPIWLGKSYIDLEKKHIQCRREFAAAPKTDRDAQACVRIPPVMPTEAKKSG